MRNSLFIGLVLPAMACSSPSEPVLDNGCFGNIAVVPSPVDVAVGDSVLVVANVESCLQGVDHLEFSLSDPAAATLRVVSDSSVMVFGSSAREARLNVHTVPSLTGITVPLYVR